MIIKSADYTDNLNYILQSQSQQSQAPLFFFVFIFFSPTTLGRSNSNSNSCESAGSPTPQLAYKFVNRFWKLTKQTCQKKREKKKNRNRKQRNKKEEQTKPKRTILINKNDLCVCDDYEEEYKELRKVCSEVWGLWSGKNCRTVVSSETVAVVLSGTVNLIICGHTKPS